MNVLSAVELTVKSLQSHIALVIVLAFFRFILFCCTTFTHDHIGKLKRLFGQQKRSFVHVLEKRGVV